MFKDVADTLLFWTFFVSGINSIIVILIIFYNEAAKLTYKKTDKIEDSAKE